MTSPTLKPRPLRAVADRPRLEASSIADAPRKAPFQTGGNPREPVAAANPEWRSAAGSAVSFPARGPSELWWRRPISRASAPVPLHPGTLNWLFERAEKCR